MKRSKKFLSVLAALTVGAAALFSFAGCGNSLQTKLDALQQQYEALQDLYDQQQDRLEDLEHENNELRNRLEDYENPESYTDEEILEMFDLDEGASVWADRNQEFAFDIVLISFKKTRVFPKLKLENLHLSKAEYLEYLSLKPKDMSDADEVESYRQTAFIHLKERTREAVITTIRELEALPFICSAEPNYIFSLT